MKQQLSPELRTPDCHENVIRTVMVNDEPWFVLKDIADTLGAKSASSMARSLTEDKYRYGLIRTQGGMQTLIFLSESGFYRLLMRGNGEKAKRCSTIITHAVSDYFEYVESKKRLPRGMITQTALTGDFATASSMVKAPIRDAERISGNNLRTSAPLTDDEMLEYLKDLGFDVWPECLNDLAFIGHVVHVLQTCMAGLDVTPRSLFGKIADALNARFEVVESDLSDEADVRGRGLAKKRSYVQKDRFGTLDASAPGGKYVWATHPVTGKKMMRSKLVVETERGYPLGEAEMVHHANGDRQDDRADNLICMTRKEHAWLHKELCYVASDRDTKWWLISAEEQRSLLDAFRDNDTDK